MKISKRLKDSVIQELTSKPDQTDLEVSVMLGVPARDVKAVREEMVVEPKIKEPVKKVNPPKEPEATRYYLRLPSGVVEQLVQKNTSQSIILLEKK